MPQKASAARAKGAREAGKSVFGMYDMYDSNILVCFIQKYFSLWRLEVNREIHKCDYTKCKTDTIIFPFILVLLSFITDFYFCQNFMVPFEIFSAKTF